jgi:SulP family sulfate permease
MTSMVRKPSFVDLFTPKLVTALREGYGSAQLRADAMAGLTVAVVALPLSMAIAIACGVSPERGLYTSIFGGVVVSLLGGSRFQIGGPAGAFILLVSATLAKNGMDSFVLSIFLSGFVLMAIGFFRLGTFIKYIPYPVTVGFTAGIALIIFSGEIHDLLGLRLAGPEPGPLIPKLEALSAAIGTINLHALAVAAGSIALIVCVQRLRPHWPAYLVAIAIAALAAWALHLPVETLGTRFGGVARTLPVPHLPSVSPKAISDALPAALSFALLGGIESLLSAVVADSMTGRRHRSNCELVAQGAANIVSAVFGGICVTGTIARTATNVRAGARTPIAGVLHAVFLVVVVLAAAPLAAFIPLAALAAVLTVVCWNMAEKQQVATLLRASRGDAVVVLTTLAIVVFRDLTQGILAGFALGALLFLHRMAQAVEVERPSAGFDDQADSPADDESRPYDGALAADPKIVVFRISGAFFFGAAAHVAAALDDIGDKPEAYVIDFADVTIIDSTAAATIEGFVRKARAHRAFVYMAGARRPVRQALEAHGMRSPVVEYHSYANAAVAAARRKTSEADSGCSTDGGPGAASAVALPN